MLAGLGTAVSSGTFTILTTGAPIAGQAALASGSAGLTAALVSLTEAGPVAAPLAVGGGIYVYTAIYAPALHSVLFPYPIPGSDAFSNVELSAQLKALKELDRSTPCPTGKSAIKSRKVYTVKIPGQQYEEILNRQQRIRQGTAGGIVDSTAGSKRSDREEINQFNTLEEARKAFGEE